MIQLLEDIFSVTSLRAQVACYGMGMIPQDPQINMVLSLWLGSWNLSLYSFPVEGAKTEGWLQYTFCIQVVPGSILSVGIKWWLYTNDGWGFAHSQVFCAQFGPTSRSGPASTQTATGCHQRCIFPAWAGAPTLMCNGSQIPPLLPG